MSSNAINDLRREVDSCISKFQLRRASSLLNELSVNSEIELIKSKLHLLFLLNDSKAALAFYSQIPEEKKEKTDLVIVSGLLGSLDFYNALSFAVSKLKKDPTKQELLMPILNVLLVFQQFDSITALLSSEYAHEQSIPDSYLLRLAVRLLIAGREEESAVFLEKYMQRNTDNVPLQVPWLLSGHGNKVRAREILIEWLAAPGMNKSRFLEHFYYLKSEHSDIFREHFKFLEKPTTSSVSNDMELIFSGQKYPPPLWQDIINRILWQYSWKYEGHGVDIEEWFLKKSKLAALSAKHLELITHAPSGLDFLHKYIGNCAENLQPILRKSNEPFILVTSHSVFPGALALLLKYIPDLCFIRTGAVPYSNTSITRKAFNIGPPHMYKHNVSEFSRMDKHIRQGGKVVLNIDHQGPKPSSEVFDFCGLEVRYNDMLTPYIWQSKTKCFWFDADFDGQAFKFEFSKMPNCVEYDCEKTWRKAFFQSFHEHMTLRLNGQKGVCNSSVAIFENIIPQEFIADFDKIAQLVTADN